MAQRATRNQIQDTFVDNMTRFRAKGTDHGRAVHDRFDDPMVVPAELLDEHQLMPTESVLSAGRGQPPFTAAAMKLVTLNNGGVAPIDGAISIRSTVAYQIDPELYAHDLKSIGCPVDCVEFDEVIIREVALDRGVSMVLFHSDSAKYGRGGQLRAAVITSFMQDPRSGSFFYFVVDSAYDFLIAWSEKDLRRAIGTAWMGSGLPQVPMFVLRHVPIE